MMTDIPGVPEIALVSLQQFPAAGHQELVRRLSRAALGAIAFPEQARLRHVNPERVLQKLAAQQAPRLMS